MIMMWFGSVEEIGFVCSASASALLCGSDPKKAWKKRRRERN